MRTQRIETPYFVSKDHAVQYYSHQGLGPEDVHRLLMAEEIAVGKPYLKSGERLLIIDGGTRYAIEWQE